MGQLLDIVNPLHKKTPRDYIGRMIDDKVHCMKIGRQYGYDYWDGSRRHGYGGYRYDGRWAVVAQRLVETYRLADNARILDIGCGKGFLLYELTQLLPRCQVTGIDISAHAIANAKEEIRPCLIQYPAQEPLPFPTGAFDLAISLTTLHNLRLFDLDNALREMERIARQKYLVVESYRDEQELFNLQCWALTCESFFAPDEWTWLFERCGYTGDYEFIYFEGPSLAAAGEVRPSA